MRKFRGVAAVAVLCVVAIFNSACMTVGTARRLLREQAKRYEIIIKQQGRVIHSLRITVRDQGEKLTRVQQVVARLQRANKKLQLRVKQMNRRRYAGRSVFSFVGSHTRCGFKGTHYVCVPLATVRYRRLPMARATAAVNTNWAIPGARPYVVIVRPWTGSWGGFRAVRSAPRRKARGGGSTYTRWLTFQLPLSVTASATTVKSEIEAKLGATACRVLSVHRRGRTACTSTSKSRFKVLVFCNKSADWRLARQVARHSRRACCKCGTRSRSSLRRKRACITACLAKPTAQQPGCLLACR